MLKYSVSLFVLAISLGMVKNSARAEDLTIDANEEKTISGENTYSNVSIEDKGKLVVENSGKIDTDNFTNEASVTTKDGKLALTDGGTLTLRNDSTLTIYKKGVNKGLIENNGTINLESSKVEVEGGTKAQGSEFQFNAGKIGGSGTVNVGNGAKFVVNANEVADNDKWRIIDNKLNVEKGGELEVSPEAIFAVGGPGALTNEGTFSVKKREATQDKPAMSGDVKIYGSFNNKNKIENDGTIALIHENEDSVIDTNSGEINNRGAFTANKSFINNGTIITNQNLGLHGGGENNNTIVNNQNEAKNADFTISGGRFVNNGTLENHAQIQLNFGGELALNKDITGDDGVLLIQEKAQDKPNSMLMVGDKVNNAKVANKVINNDYIYLGVGKTLELARDYEAGNNATLKVDLRVDEKNQNTESGVLKVGGNVIGTTNVIVNAVNSALYWGAETLYVEAPNDTVGKNESFKVGAVMGSPYMWASKLVDDENDGHKWYLSLMNEKNENYKGDIPDFPKESVDTDEGGDNTGSDNTGGDNTGGDNTGSDKPHNIYRPEMNVYLGLENAVIEQSRGMTDDVRNGLAFEKSSLCYQESCGLAEVVPHKRSWAHISSRYAEIDAPADMDAKLWGFTGGADFYRDYNDRAGVFGSYRTGDYDLSGKGKFKAISGSEIKDKSYAGGLYYQTDDGENRVMAMAYAGRQSIDIKTDDGFAKANTHANQFGASVEGGRRYQLNERFYVTPEAGVSYMLTDIDGFGDNLEKRVSYDTLHYLEAELGVKFENVSCYDGLTRRVYFRPSVLQTFAKGDDVHLSGREYSEKVNAYKNQTLGRVRTGGQFEFNQNLAGYADVGYTFGQDYEAYDANLGVSYRF